MKAMRLAASALVATALSVASSAAPAQRQPVPGPIERLAPGQSLWAPEIAPDGPVTVVVSLALQRAYVYRNGVPIAVTTVSTGKKGHRTPTGVFTILQKAEVHRSSKYDDAPMPFMQRLTWDGVALHAGALPGHPASHGCIRLPADFARRLFAITRLGATVIVTDEAVVPEISPTAIVLDPPEVDGHVAPEDYRWNSERSPNGPLSIVISGRDRRVLVLRNGVEIGAAPILLDTPVAATTAYVLRSIDASGMHWFRLPLPGGGADAGDGPDPNRAVATGHLPDAFYAALTGVIRPGTTLLVTRDTLASSGTGKRLRVMDGAQ